MKLSDENSQILSEEISKLVDLVTSMRVEQTDGVLDERHRALLRNRLLAVVATTWVEASTPWEQTDRRSEFVSDAIAQGFKVYAYSGRGMYGAQCPAITVSNPVNFQTKTEPNVDNMGRDFVLYCR